MIFIFLWELYTFIKENFSCSLFHLDLWKLLFSSCLNSQHEHGARGFLWRLNPWSSHYDTSANATSVTFPYSIQIRLFKRNNVITSSLGVTICLVQGHNFYCFFSIGKGSIRKVYIYFFLQKRSVCLALVITRICQPLIFVVLCRGYFFSV